MGDAKIKSSKSRCIAPLSIYYAVFNATPSGFYKDMFCRLRKHATKSHQGTLKIEGITTHKFVYTRLLKFLLYSRAIQIDPCCPVQALYR